MPETEDGGVADTPVGGGRPLRAYPNWDAERREFVLHAERDDGASYADAPAPESPPWFDATLDDLEELLRLPPNWNSYSARPVEPQAAVTAIELLLKTMPDSLPKPTIIPTVRGSVQLEWHTRGIDLEIDVLSNGRYVIFCEDEQTGESWERETGEAAGLVRPVLAELARRMATSGQ